MKKSTNKNTTLTHTPCERVWIRVIVLVSVCIREINDNSIVGGLRKYSPLPPQTATNRGRYHYDCVWVFRIINE